MMSHTILLGDVREQLKTLPDNSVQCCVTSPPYFGLRDYGMSEQIGLEPTPDAFVDALVSVFREVRRVLREDGSLWVNIGDSYCNTPRGNKGDWSSSSLNGAKTSATYQSTLNAGTAQTMNKSKLPGLKSKDLIGIPWMLAFALRKDGWYLRQDIIWSKTSCMPESVKDRCTKSHEYLFLLTKSPRYYFDAEAIKTPAKQDWGTRDRQHGKYHNEGSGLQPHSGLTKSYAMANKRSVWTINPSNFKGAHFATFPEALVEPCVLAGTSERGACPQCGAPWAREIDAGTPDVSAQRAAGGDAQGEYHGSAVKDYEAVGVQNASAVKARVLASMRVRTTVGWHPTCSCTDAETLTPTPCMVLDPFLGSGTTLAVAKRLGRNGIGVELNPEYAQIAETRIAAVPTPLI